MKLSNLKISSHISSCCCIHQADAACAKRQHVSQGNDVMASILKSRSLKKLKIRYM